MSSESKPARKLFQNTEEELRELPYTSGLYYFYDKDDELLYVVKAKKLSSRIWDHLTNNLIDRERKFIQPC